MVLVQKELYAAYIGEWYISPLSISLDKSVISLTTVGQTAQITATILPADARQTVSWTSSNTSIATVDSTGLVTCVTPGDATITATTVNGLTATCSVRSSIVYDFTTQNVLTFVNRQNSYTGYGWTSGSGYYSYIQNSSYYRTNTVWKLPDADYTGTLNKIKIELSIPNQYSGGGVTTGNGADANGYGWGFGAWDTNSQNIITTYGRGYSSYTYSNGIQVLTIDLTTRGIGYENNPMYFASGQETTMRNAWNNKSLYLNAVANYPNNSGIYTYIRKVEIFTS